MNADLMTAYRFHRASDAYSTPRTAMQAMILARMDAETGRKRYLETGLASYQNTPNDRGGRFIERPAQAGLRFVGYADEIARLDHTGHYLCEDGDMGEIARGAVYQLPARNGCPIYVEAIRLSTDDDAAIVYLGERHIGDGGLDPSDDKIARDAARGADREAELYAEEERAYGAASDAGFRCSEKLGDAASEREEAREMLAELRAGVTAGPRLCAATRGLIADKLARARRLRHEVRVSIGEMAVAYSWNTRKRDILREAFADAYGYPIDWERM